MLKTKLLVLFFTSDSNVIDFGGVEMARIDGVRGVGSDSRRVENLLKAKNTKNLLSPKTLKN